MKQEKPIIRLRGLSKDYGGVHALSGVDFDIHEGELLFIVGDNGAGKSTIVNILSGAVQPNPGSEIVFEDKPVHIKNPKAAQELGIFTVFQDLSLCNDLNAFQNIFLGHELTRGMRLGHEAMERRTRDLFEEIGSNVPNPQAPVGTRSGGQRQAVAIAKSLLLPSKVVLMDEPTAALGVIQRKQVSKLTRSLRDTGHAVVVVSQDLDEVVKSADRVIVLRIGEIESILDGGTFTRDDLVAHITGIHAS
ncbi:ATP-binding cassette domain-containing protein [Agathobaculum sp.]|uniref:ATP-binding cassette domain-containing protein n=1 Tax=Agathobaculum sp. TaxID=2048138 RepID=UPI002A817C76|nr:ATP-binding cassette domain-containing protein [Agathobaculum sp.]MDY3619065.1 ATP-binding cassette domain-containing protein [Agathobaculum sp.]